MRAPPLSLRPMTGAPTFIAMSMTLQIFWAWRSRQRAAEHGEVLREDVDQAAVDRARSGDDAVAGELLASPCRSRRNCARRTCHILRSCPHRAGRSAARGRSGGPWRAAPRCASRRRRASRLRAAVRVLRWSSPSSSLLGRASFHDGPQGSIRAQVVTGTKRQVPLRCAFVATTRGSAHVAPQHGRICG